MKTLRKQMAWGRRWFAAGLVTCLLAGPAAAELPRDKAAVLSQIRQAIETKDYETLRRLVFWKGAGKIKKRVVRFHLNRALGRKIKSITWEDFPADGMAGVLATGKLVPNMTVTHAVRVVFDEPPVAANGKPPTAVFLVGKRRQVFRIGLVIRAGVDDDDD